MPNYAVVYDVPGDVVYIVSPVDGFNIEQCFTLEMRKHLYPCPDGVGQGWRFDGTSFFEPVDSAPPAPQEETAHDA